jgi:8-oxo-dGTP diphosphatase
MPNERGILKVGLAVTDAHRLLVVKKKGSSIYILPGGKPELGEDDFKTLAREIEEELGCELNRDTIVFLGCFSDEAADIANMTVTVKLYAAELIGDPAPRSEIEALKWFCPSAESTDILAPSLQHQIIPFLVARGDLSCERAGSRNPESRSPRRS